jgi:hypothetical protein
MNARTDKNARKRPTGGPPRTLRTARKQRGGVTGRGFLPGQSGNPGGRPKSERTLLRRMYGDAGEQVYERLEALRSHAKTPAKLKAQIDFFLIERLHGRAQQHVEVEGGAHLVDLLAAASARLTKGAA